jgi:hypothetical protein
VKIIDDPCGNRVNNGVRHIIDLVLIWKSNGAIAGCRTKDSTVATLAVSVYVDREGERKTNAMSG